MINVAVDEIILVDLGFRPCRYQFKRHYPTRADARVGAQFICSVVTARGDVYNKLHPFRCPDAGHWHLSHYPQGYRDCPFCEHRVPAWNGGAAWIIGAHAAPCGNRCPGEGGHVS